MNNYTMRDALTKFKACADESPEGCYEDAKAINTLIGETCDRLMREVRALELKASATDLAFDLECAIYDYIKRSNPSVTLFVTAESFGSGMDSPARERVLAQAIRNRDSLRALHD